MKVTVVGSGAIGLTIAFRLAQHDVDVLVVDKNELGRKSSWAGAGILPPSNDQDPTHALEHLQSISNRLHPLLSRELFELTGIDNEFQACGGIYLARTAGEAASLAGTACLFEEQGIRFEWLSRDSLEQLEPVFAHSGASGFQKAMHIPTESQLRNPRHLQALIAACKKLNVEFLPATPVDEVMSTDRKAKVRSGDKWIDSDAVCIATGAWTTPLVESLSQVQVVPIKGHMLLYKLDHVPFRHVINEANRYIVCRNDGYVLVGSTEEECGFDESVSSLEVERLQQFAESMSSQLNTNSFVKCWTGLRPMAFDHLPYIGVHSEIANLFIATGHFRSGLHLSPATAEVICNLILGRENEFDISALRPER